MRYNLVNTDNLEPEDIEKLVLEGASFRIFKYRIALIAIAFSRISPAILIRNEADFKLYRNKYNLKTFLFGLWFFPFGPINVFQTIKFNNSGAIDITGDILLNLGYYNKDSQIIDLVNIYTLFDHLPKSDFKELKTALLEFCHRKIEIREVYAGKYINVENNCEPPYLIGVNADLSKESIEDEMKKLIYKKFHKFAQFEIFIKLDDPDLYDTIVKQGQEIIKKKGM